MVVEKSITKTTIVVSIIRAHVTCTGTSTVPGTWYRQRQATVAKSLTNLNPNNFVLVGNYYLPKAYLKFVELVPKSADKRALLCKIVPTSIEVFVSVKCSRLFFGQVMLANTTQEFAEGLFRPEKKTLEHMGAQ